MTPQKGLDQDCYRKILNYFFFVFVDESKALQAATAAAHELQKRYAKNSSTAVDILLVESLEHVRVRFSKQRRTSVSASALGAWTKVAPKAMTAWREALRDLDADSVHVFVMSALLGIDGASIAEGLGITEGTVWYRSARVLQSLGGAGAV